MEMTRDSLERMDEASLRANVLMPLMKKMGFNGVFEWHGGAGELGKDIVGWKLSEFGSRRNTVVVAKATRLSGSRAVGEVATQVRQALNRSYRDPQSDEEQQAHQCWIVTNKRLGKEARDGVRAALDPHFNRVTEIWDIDELWEAARINLGFGLGTLLEETKRVLDTLEPRYTVDVETAGDGRPVATIETGGHRFILKERYPGQAEDEPITFSVTMQFPDTPEGRLKLEEYRRAIESGDVAEIPGDYVQAQFPEIFRSLAIMLYGAPPEHITSLSIGNRPPPHAKLVRLTVECDDGDTISLDNLEWKAAKIGTEQLTLSNDHQPHPLRISLTVNFRSKAMNMSISKKEGPTAAPMLFDLYRLLQCIGKPGVLHIYLVDPGLPLGSARTEQFHMDPIDEEWLEIYSVLSRVQRKTSVPIYVPDREFTEEEWTVIECFYALYQTNEAKANWTSFTFELEASAAQRWLDAYTKQPTRVVEVDLEQSAQLFDAILPLGPVHYRFDDAVLVNLDEVKQAIVDDSDNVLFVFEPGESNAVASKYLDW